MTYERKLYVALRQKNKIKINKIIEQIYHSYGKSVGFIISKYVEDCNVVLKLTNDVFYNFSKVLNSVKIDNINYYLTIQAKRTVIDYLNSVKNFKLSIKMNILLKKN